MAKFNTTGVRSRNAEGFIGTTGNTELNHKGSVGFERDAKSELFLSCVSDFVEDSFYESSSDRQTRVKGLIRQIAKTDAVWLQEFTEWLRNSAQMRSISLVVALESADALRAEGVAGGRKIVSSALSRADEPGEALAYWMSQKGRKIPASVKRGISDAAVKLFNEYSVAKYNSANAGFSLADVIKLTHPTPKDSSQADLFKYVMERDFDANTPVPKSLTKLTERKRLLSLPDGYLRDLISTPEGSQTLANAGLTWEAVAGKVGLNAKTWEALIPNMGYMALLRNLRNFEKEGVSDAVLDEVARRLADPEEVGKSRQLPFRFLSAYNATQGSLRFAYPLEKALNHSLSNVPSLKGKTLVLVDRSGSMFNSPGRSTGLNFADSAAIFGSALALRAENAKLVQYGDSWYANNPAYKTVDFKKSDSVLPLLKKFEDMGGTDTGKAIKGNFDKTFDRVVLLTDEQSYYGGVIHPGTYLPENVPMYTWNLAGYKYGQTEAKPNRVTLGGLNDQSFKLIPLVESGTDAVWPWQA